MATAGATASCTGFAFCDDFEDGNSTGWTPSGGTWTVVTDGSSVYSGGLGSFFSTAGAATGDQTVQARMKVLALNSGSSYRAGIVARFASSSNYYTVVIDGAGDVRLMKGSSSVSGASGTCAAEPSGLSSVVGSWVTLRLKVSGSSSVHIQSWLNGDVVHDCTTTSGTVASGAFGVLTYGTGSRAAFDDVQVSTP